MIEKLPVYLTLNKFKLESIAAEQPNLSNPFRSATVSCHSLESQITLTSLAVKVDGRVMRMQMLSLQVPCRWADVVLLSRGPELLADIGQLAPGQGRDDAVALERTAHRAGEDAHDPHPFLGIVGEDGGPRISHGGVAPATVFT